MDTKRLIILDYPGRERRKMTYDGEDDASCLLPVHLPPSDIFPFPGHMPPTTTTADISPCYGQCDRLGLGYRIRVMTNRVWLLFIYFGTKVDKKTNQNRQKKTTCMDRQKEVYKRDIHTSAKTLFSCLQIFL